MTRKDRAYAAAVLGSVLALVLAVVLVFQFGRHHPSPPSLTEHPNSSIPGTLVYFDKDGCIIRVAASGASREKTSCSADRGAGVVAWIDAHTVVYQSFESPGPKWVIVDLDTGKTTIVDPPKRTDGSPIFMEMRGLLSVRGESIAVDGKTGKIFVIVDGKRNEIADFDAQEYGGPQPLTWSPDGNWILLSYHPPRNQQESELWVVSRDGAFRGTLAKDAAFAGASWWIEGLGAMPKVDGVPAAK